MRFAGGYATALAAILAGLVLYVAGLRYAYAPPAARPESAPLTEFSATRARSALGRVLEGGAPHPVGTDAAAVVRARIAEELRAVGLAPSVRPGFACRGGACAFVQNVVAAMPGLTEEAVLLSAHYDSVPAAGGAGDDGTGVATLLEIARALGKGPRPPLTMLFVFDEGEEEGLLGATAFASDPEFSRVRAAVNVDARGNGGPALIFETSQDNAAVMSALARVERPFTGSAFASAYASMPNDTDFSVWKARKEGLEGANVALLGDLASYHSPLDRLENVDDSALQHEGDVALALARGLAEAAPKAPGHEVWFDVLGARVVHFPEAWCPRIGGAALFFVLLAVGLRAARGRVRPLELIAGLGALPFATLGAGALTVSLTSTLMSSGVLPAPWTANGPLAMAAMWAFGAALGGAATATLARGLGEGLWCGIWSTLALVGAALAWKVPSASHLATLPALLAGVLGVATAWSKRDDVGDGTLLLAAMVPALAQIVLVAPLAFLVYGALGLPAAPNAAVLGALMAVAFAPVFALAASRTRWIVTGLAALTGLVLTALAARAPPFTEQFPSRANVVYLEDERAARAMVDTTWGAHAWGPVPAAMRTALGIAREGPGAPWSPAPVLQTDLPRAELPGPSAETVGTGDDGAERRVSLRLQSGRGARVLSLLLPPDARARIARVGGVAVDGSGPGAMTATWRELRVSGVPAEGVVVELVAAREPVTVTLVDETSGLPPAAAPIAAARPKDAVPTQRGDVTLVSRTRAL